MNIYSMNISISKSFISTHGCTLSFPNFVFSRFNSNHFLQESTKNRRSTAYTLLNKKNTFIVSSSVALGSQISDWAQEDEDDQILRERKPVRGEEEAVEEEDEHIPFSDPNGDDTEARFSGFDDQIDAVGGEMEDDVVFPSQDDSRVSEVVNPQFSEEKGENSILEGRTEFAGEMYGDVKVGEEKNAIDNVGRMDLADSSARDLGLGDGFTFPLEYKVYVGNFAYDTDSQKLADLFTRAGTVELTEIVYNRMTGQSRGFGFVTMSSPEEAANAIKMFHLYEFNGRTLIVNKALTRGSLAGDAGQRLRCGIFVGNLSADSTKEQLKELFSAHGTVVDTQVITDRETGSPRGFGFVNMSSDIEQSDAISALDGQTFNGRVLTVNKAAPKGASLPVFTAFIANIPWEVDEAQLQQMFGQHGRVLSLRVICDRETGLSRGYGFVKLSSEIELTNAVSALNGKILAGRMLRVMKAVPKSEFTEQRMGSEENRFMGGQSGRPMMMNSGNQGPRGSNMNSTQSNSVFQQQNEMESAEWDRGFSEEVRSESQDRNLDGMVEPWNDDDDDIDKYESGPPDSEFDF